MDFQRYALNEMTVTLVGLVAEYIMEKVVMEGTEEPRNVSFARIPILFLSVKTIKLSHWKRDGN